MLPKVSVWFSYVVWAHPFLVDQFLFLLFKYSISKEIYTHDARFVDKGADVLPQYVDRKISKPRDSYSDFSIRSKTWQAPRQLRLMPDPYNIQSCGFETSTANYDIISANKAKHHRVHIIWFIL